MTALITPLNLCFGKASNVTATVYYAKLTTTLDDATDSFELPAEDWDMIYDFTEAILHLHMRNYKEVKRKLEELQATLQIGFPGTVLPVKGDKA